MSEHLANNAQTTLAASILDSDTTLTVTSSSGFPSPNFRILVDEELMLVTGVSGTTWTVTRGVESTSAVAHDAAVDVTCVLTAGSLAAYIYQGTLPATPQSDGAYILVVSGGVPSWVSTPFA